MRKRDKKEKDGKTVNIKFEGRKLIAYEGETVAEALFANGINVFSLGDKYFRPRGLFCKDGKCRQCKMNINGNRNALACRTYVMEGMSIKRNVPKFRFNDLKNLSFFKNLPFFIFLLKNFLIPLNMDHKNNSSEEYSTEILIIGGGDAGKAALNTLKKYNGNGILVSDETLDNENMENIKVIENTRIFSIEGKTAYGISNKGIIKINANKIIIATGSYNVDRIFQNNDLPGIMLYSAVKNLIEKNIMPGKNAVIFGSSDEEERIADLLESSGIHVNGIISDNLFKTKYNLFYAYTIKRAIGYRGLRGIEIIKGKLFRRINCDLLVLTDKTKNIDLVLNVNGKVEYLKDRKTFFPVRDRNLLISRNVYYAGNFSADESIAEGEKAALHAMNMVKRKNEKIVEIVGVKNENNLQVTRYNM